MNNVWQLQEAKALQGNLRKSVALFPGHHGRHIRFRSGNGFDVKFFNQGGGHARRQKARKGGPEPDAFKAQGQQRQKHQNGFLFIPGNIKGNRKIIDILQAKGLLKLHGNNGQGIGIIALAGIENPGDSADIPEIQLDVFVFCTPGRQDNGVFGQGLGHFGIIIPCFMTAVTPGHNDKSLDGAGFHGSYDFVGQGKNLVAAKPAIDIPCFDFLGRFAGFSQFDQG